MQNLINLLFVFETAFITYLVIEVWRESRTQSYSGEFENKWFEEDKPRAKKNTVKSQNVAQGKATAKKRGRPAGSKNRTQKATR